MSRPTHTRQTRKDARRQTSTIPKPAPPEDPAQFATTVLGLQPDPVQLDLLRADPRRLILNCCRQWGKSTITAAKAVHRAWFHPHSLILVLSPSERQSAEFVRKASGYLDKLGVRARGDGDNETSLLLPNRSRIVGLPGKETTIRGFSGVSLLLIDEASRVPDELYLSVRPMLAASNGQLWIISTPNGRRGFFHDIWANEEPDWTRISIPADQCPRIAPEVLEEERRSMPPHFFEQEYLCQFHDSDDAVYSLDVLNNALAPIRPLLLPSRTPHPAILEPRYYIGIDLGQKNDYTAIAILERASVISGPRDPVTFELPRQTTYSIRHLERLPLGTPYLDVVAHLRALSRHPQLGAHKQFIVDATGVGQPVVELIRGAGLDGLLIPVTITSGGAVSRKSIYWRVPRHELLSKLEVALRQEQLKISAELPEAPALLKELQSLRRRVKDSGDESVRPSRATQHDDLVFAAALANWRATLHT